MGSSDGFRSHFLAAEEVLLALSLVALGCCFEDACTCALALAALDFAAIAAMAGAVMFLGGMACKVALALTPEG